MLCFGLISVAALAATALAFQVGPKPYDSEILKRDYDHYVQHFSHKRHIARQLKAKRASTSKKCKSKTKTKTSPSSSSSGTSSATGGDDGQSSSTSSSGNSTSSDSGSSSSSSGTSDVGNSGISQFLGTNTGIGSWFRTNNGNDDTNGRSWCQLNYQDDWMGFAPDVSTMLGNFGNDITKAGTAYCGREAKATNPNNGKTALIYIVDGFDPAWVKSPGSIDLTLAAFAALYGSETDDKNTVIQNLQWEFTGNVKQDYTFNSCCR